MGLQPLPVKPGEKHPYLKWRRLTGNYSFIQLASEFTPDKGLWSAVGRVTGYITLDCDNAEGVLLWRERLGDQFDKTARVRTRKGVHLWWVVESDGPPIDSWNQQSDPEALERGARYDLQADGRGVMLPPSRHADDPSFVYTWEVMLSAALPAPAALLVAPNRVAGQDASGRVMALPEGTRDATTTAKTGRSLLAALLLRPPAEGERNDWHAKVAGHLVKMGIPYLDAFEALGLALNRSMALPDDEDAVLKTWRHRWDEHQEDRKGDLGTLESGMLIGNGGELYATVRKPVGKDQFVLDRAHWANADLVAIGVIDSDTTGRTYAVRVQRQDGLVRQDLITPGLLGSANDTNKWLARHGVSVMSPQADIGSKLGHVGQRLLRYLEWQKPDAYIAVNYLGWHAEVGFVTHEGIISRAGMRPHEGVMPDPLLRDLAPYHYGMGDAAEARRVLREVLTYQDETVCAVFGAWWAATLLKGQLMALIGHFPYFLINAASEAGKTRGFFSMMRTLAGSTKIGIGTRASIRDFIGAHRNGIVHIDDPDDVGDLGELLRAATGESIISKKGGDNRTTVETKMVAPILLSGESLPLGEEKAQRDRSIRIEVPTPVGRMSTRDPNRPQIDDIKALEHAHPDLTEFAGTYVHLALQHEGLLAEFATLRGAAGRHNEIKAIVRLGARVLAAMVAGGPGDTYDSGWIIRRADAWAADQQDMGAANTLLTRVLPWALSHDLWRGAGSAVGHPPAYVSRKGEIWVSVERLAAEWRKECQRQGVRDRLSSDDAIRAQLRAVGSTGSEAQWIVNRRDRGEGGPSAAKRARYVMVPQEYNDLVLCEMPEPTPEERTAGLASGAADDYGMPSQH